MYYQASLLDIPNAISSPELASGVTPSDKPDGQTIDQPGQEVALASLSARQAKEAGLTTSGTYGRPSTGSSASVDLMLSLASRLRQRTDLLGSTLFKLTWKQRGTPLGRSIYALRASAHRTSGSGFSSWPSPLANKTTPQQRDDFTPNLAAVAQLTGWPTPRTVTGGAESAERKQELGRTESGGGDLQAAAMLASWATPKAATGAYQYAGGDHEKVVLNLEGQAQLTSWTTPSSRDWKDTPGMATDAINPDGSERIRLDMLPRQAQLTDSGETRPGSIAATGSSGQLNPALARWLMGLPEEWDVALIRAHRLTTRTTRRKAE